MDDYKKKYQKNADRNQKCIDLFVEWLSEKKLTEKTIVKHINNIDFYLNDYLNYYSLIPMEKGIEEVYSYLDDWFIKKCSWASMTSIKENAASIKKFYKCMAENNLIKVEKYNKLCEIIKDNLDVWIEDLYIYEYDLFNDMYL